MNIFNFRHSNSGIGLIEVLVTTVIIAVGLLAVASLQGNLIGSSRDNKTRAEAKALADSKIEQLRDTVVKTGYDALASSATAESIGGITENFNRSWTVTNQTSPERKQVSVSVCWPAGACADNIIVQSSIGFDDVGNAAKNLKDAQSGSSLPGGPSLNAQASNEITEKKDVADGDPGSHFRDNPDSPNKIWIREDSRTKGTAAYLCSTLGLTAFENGLFTRRINHDGVTGNEAIELYEQTILDNLEYCIPRIRYNGGVIVPVRGIVHSGATTGNGNNTTYLDVDLFTFNASETGAFCVFNPVDGAKSAPYACYVGGNCTGFVCDANTGNCDDNDVTKCPIGAYAAATVGPGGWRGKVGLLGVANTSNDFRNVCFQEEIAATPASLDTARNYYALRNSINEGINKPYSCHDFLIIDGQPTLPKVHDECVKQASEIGGFLLASKNIQRTISSGNNVFDPTIDTGFCSGSTGTAYTINGTISGAASAPSVSITDGTSVATCTPVSSTAYTCTFTTSASSVTISGAYNNQPQSCNLSIDASNTTPTGCALAFTSMPTYTITGVITGPDSTAINAVTLEVQDGANTISCPSRTTIASNKIGYTCNVATNSTTVNINASVTGSYVVSPTTRALASLSGGGSVTLSSPDNDFVVTAIPTYTVSGSISLGNNVDNITSLTLNAANPTSIGCSVTPPNGGWKKNTSGTYTCSIYGGSNTITMAISPTCSNTKVGNQNAFKKYTQCVVSSGTTCGTPTTTGTGQLVIDLGNVTGNQTKNLRLEESTTSCS